VPVGSDVTAARRRDTHRGVGVVCQILPFVTVSDHSDWPADQPSVWMRTYIRRIAVADFSAAIRPRALSLRSAGSRVSIESGRRQWN
jgi:hypothetical protein